MALDVEALLQPISEDEPSGPDLSYDPDFRRISRELDEAAQKEKPGEDPVVEPAAATAVALLGKSHDLWTASHGVCLALYAANFELAADLMRVMAGHLERFWDTCHPLLEEGSDPAAGRREACRQLASVGRLTKHVERLYLAPLKSKGRLTFIDIAGPSDPAASGAQILAGMPDQIRMAVRDTDAEAWAAFSEQLGGLLQGVDAITRAFSEKAPGQEPDLGLFHAVVARIKSLADAIVAEKNPAAVPDTVAGPEVSAASPAGSVRMPLGPIATREQAIAQLEAVKAFFLATEPSSPLPLLIDRVKRLAGMDFMALLQNLAPGGVDDAARILEPPQPEEEAE